jgi:acetyl-CoA carboxylase/biotin carboxylase 1
MLTWNVNEGAAISAGDLLASLELENPENVSKVSVFRGKLNVSGDKSTTRVSVSTSPHLILRFSIDTLNEAMSGYILSGEDVEKALLDLADAVTRPMLPVYEIQEQLSVLSGRIPSSLFQSISAVLTEFKNSCEMKAGSGVELR